jgi:hypothetical protein
VSLQPFLPMTLINCDPMRFPARDHDVVFGRHPHQQPASTNNNNKKNDSVE